MKTLKVRLTFTEPLLGTWPANQNVAREYIASKGPDAATIEDEVAALGADAAADKAMTVFPRNEAGQPILYDYQVKGFFKDSCGMLGRIGGKDEKGKKKAVNESGKLTAYKKIIDLADVMLAVYDGDTPATGNAEDRVLAYAESLEKPLVLLHPTELTTMCIGWPFRTG